MTAPSYDLSMMDYAVWGIVKDQVHQTQLSDIAHLSNLIKHAFEDSDERLIV